MTKKRKILLTVPAICILVLAFFFLLFARGREIIAKYDDPESLWRLAERTERYIIRANPDKGSPARQEALKALGDIAKLELPEEEKSRLIRERFPEESFWPDELKDLLRKAESGDREAQFQLGCLYEGKKENTRQTYIDYELGKCVMKSAPLAAKWFRLAALQGQTTARFRLALCYLNPNDPGHPAHRNMAAVSRKAKERIAREADAWLNLARKDSGNHDDTATVMRYAAGMAPIGGQEEQQFAMAEVCDLFMEEDSASLREAAGQGDVLAMFTLAKRPPPAMLEGFHSSRTEHFPLAFLPERAEWLRRAAERGYASGMWEYANALEQLQGETGEHTKTVQDWRQKAFDTAMEQLNGGNAESLHELVLFSGFPLTDPFNGTSLEDFIGGENKEAFINGLTLKLWSCVEHGDFEFAPGIISKLMSCYMGTGKIPEMDTMTVRRRFAEPGFFNERLDYASMGFKVKPPKEQAEALETLRTLAGFGMPDARLLLGFFYGAGVGIPQDKAEADKWLTQAIDQRSSEAMIERSEQYKSVGGSKNALMARYWKTRAGACMSGYDSIPEAVTAMISDDIRRFLNGISEIFLSKRE